MANIVTGLKNWLGTGFPQESELRSETSAHHIKMSLSQVKVRRAPTASAQQSQIVISEVPVA